MYSRGKKNAASTNGTTVSGETWNRALISIVVVGGTRVVAGQARKIKIPFGIELGRARVSEPQTSNVEGRLTMTSAANTNKNSRGG